MSRSTFGNHQESGMNTTRPLVIVASFIFSVQPASAQEAAQYPDPATERLDGTP